MTTPTKLSDFASQTEPIQTGHLSGYKLNICGEEYEAWDYDSYIYEAIEIAKCWPASMVSYARITHLRNWLRENVQHGHNIPTENVESIADTKKFIDQVIKAEYLHAEGKEFKQIEKDELAQNSRIFPTGIQRLKL